MNNYRLSTNIKLSKEEKFKILDIEISKVFNLKAPYNIKNGIRFYSGTNK
jgi:hypothetical protein